MFHLLNSSEMRMWKIYHLRRILYSILILCIFYGIIEFFRAQWYMKNFEEDLKRWGVQDKLIYINTSDPQMAGEQACKHPLLDVHAKEIMKHVKPGDPIVCSDIPDWVTVDGNVAKITEEAKNTHGGVECKFTDIIRESDSMNKKGIVTRTRTDFEFRNSDYAKVTCTGDGSTKKWKGILSGIRKDLELYSSSSWDYVKNNGLPLNVLIWGHDSLARNMFIRQLPKTYKLMKEQFDALVLEGYNIVGDGTPQALIPILTGKTELELPETRKRMGDKANFVNVYPFIWNDFKRAGYITAFNEDAPSIGTFTYRLKGFNDQPTDHYMRTFYVSASPEFGSQKKLCMGSLPRHKIAINQVKNMYKIYPDKPKFIFSFLSEFSHDSINQINAVDDDLVDFLLWFQSNGHFNNTLIIFMSDHGHRFTKIRDSQQGKQEERLPMFSFMFPPWFQYTYPVAYNNFKTNTKRLTTPFDINPTLKSILNFPPNKGLFLGKGDLKNRSISLFYEVPKERTCENANIEPHWCACLAWHELKPNQDPLTKLAAEALVDTINRETKTYRNICDELHLSSLLWAGRFQPHKDLLQFKKNADMDGFVADLSDHTEISHVLYQIKIRAQPGNGLFEASLRYDTKDKTFALRIEDVSRINKYGSAAHCVEQSQEQLRKFCYCKEPPPSA